MKIKKGPDFFGTLSLNIFLSNNMALSADPEVRTEVIKPIIKTVVTDEFHLAFNLSSNIDILF